MSFEIVTDSAANLTDEIIDSYGLNIVSLTFHVADKDYYSYVKGQPTDIKQYYDMMRAGQTISTSQMGIEACRDVFDRILAQGKDLLYIGFSSALSGTYNAGALTAADLREKYPERKIYTIDTLSASLGEGLLVYYAAEQRKAGRSIDEVFTWLKENILRMCHWFTVDDLQFLKRGGRLSATTALVGTILGIKPIMHVNDEGQLVPVGKVRGRKSAIEALVKEMAATCVKPQEQMIFITHGDCIDDAKLLEKMVNERFNVKGVVINYVDPVIGAHSGPGTLALFFLGSKR